MTDAEYVLKHFKGKILDIQTNFCLTSETIRRSIDSICEHYVSVGIPAGSIVPLIFSSGFKFILHFFALLHMEAIPVLMSRQTTSDEWIRMRSRHGWEFLITDCQGVDSPNYKEEKEIHLFHTPLSGGYTLIKFNASCKAISLKNVYIQPTSGSTGASKLCVRSINAAVNEAVNISERMGLTKRESSILCPLSLNHAFGFGSAFMLSMIFSCHLYLLNSYNPKKLQRFMEHNKVDILTAVPPMISFIEKGLSANSCLPSKILSAGSPLESDLYRSFRNKFGVGIYSAYGSTETGKISILNDKEVYEAGDVGTPLSQNKIRLMPSACTDNSLLEIQVQTNSMMEGYFQPNGTIIEAYNADGWFPTGDLGGLTEQGHLLIQGRSKHMINVFGIKVNPEEICAVLKSIQGIEDAHVYRGKHRSGSDIVQAIVTLSMPLKEYEIISRCKELLSHQKVPSRIIIVDNLPRTLTGKIITQQLPV